MFYSWAYLDESITIVIWQGMKRIFKNAPDEKSKLIDEDFPNVVFSCSNDPNLVFRQTFFKSFLNLLLGLRHVVCVKFLIKNVKSENMNLFFETRFLGCQTTKS